jgi:hypothetical protein
MESGQHAEIFKSLPIFLPLLFFLHLLMHPLQAHFHLKIHELYSAANFFLNP